MPILEAKELFQPNIVDNGAPEALFTVPNNSNTTIVRNGRVRFSNVSAAPTSIKCWAVPPGGSVADSNVVLPLYPLAVGGYVDVPTGVIAATGKFYAQAGNASSVSAVCLDGIYQTV